MKRLRSSSDYYIQRVISNKRNAPCFATSSPLVESSLMFEEILVLGCRPSVPRYQNRCGSSVKPVQVNPDILIMFPSTNVLHTQEEYDQIVSFCFPAGFKRLTESNKLIIQSAFPFYLGNDSMKKYCFCVQFQAPSDYPPFFSTNYSRRYQFAICIISKKQMLTPHAQFLGFLIYAICGRAIPNTLPSFTSKMPHVDGFCLSSLKCDQRYPNFAVIDGINVTKVFYDSVNFFYSMDSSQFQNVKLSSRFNLTCPSDRSGMERLAYPSIPFLMSMLPSNIIVMTYTAFLLDLHVVLYSRYPTRAAFCVIAISLLCKPFNSSGTVIPILPNDCFDVLETPTPYIAGICKPYKDADLMVDIDTKSITTKNLPSLPGENDLIRKLDLVTEISINDENSPLIVPTICSDLEPLKYEATPFFVDSILSVFINHINTRLTSTLQPFLVTDRSNHDVITVLNTELLLESSNPIERPFFASFVHTQVFDDFVEKITCAHQNQYEDTSCSNLAHSE